MAPPRSQGAGMIAFMTYQRMEVMANCGLGPGEERIRGSPNQIGRRHSINGFLPPSTRVNQAFDEVREGIVLGGGRLGAAGRTISIEQLLEVGWKGRDLKERKEIGIRKQQVAEDPGRMMLTRSRLQTRLAWGDTGNKPQGVITGTLESPREFICHRVGTFV